MKSKQILVLGTLLLSVFWWVLWAAPAPQGSAGSREDELAYINSLHRLISDLAAEKFNENSARNETWIFTVHDGNGLRKYMDDKKYTLISLPARDKADYWAMMVYSGHYNSLILQSTDLIVKTGNYATAKQVYQLLLRFACKEKGGLPKEPIERRLALLAQLESGKDVPG